MLASFIEAEDANDPQLEYSWAELVLRILGAAHVFLSLIWVGSYTVKWAPIITFRGFLADEEPGADEEEQSVVVSVF